MSIAHGTKYGNSVASLNNVVFWLGGDTFGHNLIFASAGYTPKRISNKAIERRLEEASKLDDAFGFCYQQDGTTFYVLTFPSERLTLVYDLLTGEWHERTSLDRNTWKSREWLPTCYSFAFGEHIVGDRFGNILALRSDIFTDNMLPTERIRVTPHLGSMNKYIRYNSFEAIVSTGMTKGLTKLTLDYSNDGGYTWTNETTIDIAREGEFNNRAVFRRLGTSRNRVFRIKYSGTQYLSLRNAIIDIEVANE